jgi:hypothetical protein
MSLRNPRPGVLVVVTLLVAAALACNFNLPSVSGPAAPCSVTTSKEAADRLAERIRVASQKDGETVTITATSEELSSLIEQSLNESQQSSEDTLKLENAVVCFQDGKMSLHGTVSPDGQTKVNALITVTPSVSNGKVAITVNSFEVGPIPVPESLREQIGEQISETLNERLDKISLSAISISDGEMTLTGKVR